MSNEEKKGKSSTAKTGTSKKSSAAKTGTAKKATTKTAENKAETVSTSSRGR